MSLTPFLSYDEGSAATPTSFSSSPGWIILIFCGLGTASILMSLQGVAPAEPGLPVADGVTLSADRVGLAVSNLMCGCKFFP